MGVEAVVGAVLAKFGIVGAGGAAATIGTAVSAGAYGAAAAAALAGAAYITAVSYLAGAVLSSTLSPSAGNQGFTQVSRQSDRPRQLVYGTRKVSGPLVYARSRGDDWKLDDLGLVIALTGHPVEDIIGLVLGEDYLPIAGSTFHPDIDTYGNSLSWDNTIAPGRYLYSSEGGALSWRPSRWKVHAGGAIFWHSYNDSDKNPVFGALNFEVIPANLLHCLGKSDIYSNINRYRPLAKWNNGALKVVKCNGWAVASDDWFGGAENKPTLIPWEDSDASGSYNGWQAQNMQQWIDCIYANQLVDRGLPLQAEQYTGGYKRYNTTENPDPSVEHKAFWGDVHNKTWMSKVLGYDAWHPWLKGSTDGYQNGTWWSNREVKPESYKDAPGWGPDHKLTNCAHIALNLDYDADKDWRTSLPNIAAIVKGKRIYDPRDDDTSEYFDSGISYIDTWKNWDKYDGTDGSQRFGNPYTYKWSNNWALVCLDYMLDKDLGLGIDISEIDLESFVEAANVSDELVTAPGSLDAITVTSGGTGYTSLPEVTITGDGTGAEARAVLSLNSGVVTNILITKAGTGYTTASVSITGGGGSGATATASVSTKQQRRYTVDAVIETVQKPIEVMEGLVQCGAGILTYSGGKYYLRAGKYYETPVDNIISESDLADGGISINTSASLDSLFNKARGTYIMREVRNNSAALKDTILETKPIYEPTDFELISPKDSGGDNPYQEQDGQELIKSFDYPYVCEQYQAQRLAKISMEKARKSLSANINLKLSNFKYSVGDKVYVNLPNIGWDDTIGYGDAPYKEFIITSVTLNENFTVNIEVVEDLPTFYDDDLSNYTVPEASPNYSLELIESYLPPRAPLWDTGESGFNPITSIAQFMQDGGKVNKLQLFWGIQDYESDDSITVLDKFGNEYESSRLQVPNIEFFEIQYGIVTDSQDSSRNTWVTDWLNLGSYPLLTDREYSEEENSVDSFVRLVRDIQGGIEVNVLNGFKISDDPVISALPNPYNRFDFRIRSVSSSGTKSPWVYWSDSSFNESPGYGYAVAEDNIPPPDVVLLSNPTSTLPFVKFEFDLSGSEFTGLRDLHALRLTYNTTDTIDSGAVKTDLSIPSTWDPSNPYISTTWTPSDNRQYYVWLQFVDRSGNVSTNAYPSLGSQGLPARAITASEYFIFPIDGKTAITSDNPTITLEIRSSSDREEQISNAEVRLFNDALDITNSDGYSATLDETSLNGGATIELRNTETGIVYDTISLVDTTDSSVAGVYGSFQSQRGVSASQDKNGVWTPSESLNVVNVTFYQGGESIAGGQIYITRDDDTGELTSSILSENGCEIVTIGEGTTALSIIATEDNSSVIVTETYTTSVSGNDAVQFYIKAVNGTVIKNNESGKVLEFQARKITGDEDVAVNFGNVRLYDADDVELTASNGNCLSGSNGFITYIDSTHIDDELVIQLADFSGVEGIIYQTISAIDVQDGADGTPGVLGYIDPQPSSDGNNIDPTWIQFYDDSWYDTENKDYDITFYKGDTVLARDAFRFYLSGAAGGAYVDNKGSVSFTIGSVTHTLGDLNSERITYTHEYGTGNYVSLDSNAPAPRLTVRATYDHDGETYTVEKSIFIVEYGKDASPQYYIRPLNGTTFNNGVGTLNFEGRKRFRTTDELIDSEAEYSLYWQDEDSGGFSYSLAGDGFSVAVTDADLNDSITRVLVLREETSPYSIIDSVTIVNVVTAKNKTLGAQLRKSIFNGSLDNSAIYFHGFDTNGDAVDAPGQALLSDVSYNVDNMAIDTDNLPAEYSTGDYTVYALWNPFVFPGLSGSDGGEVFWGVPVPGGWVLYDPGFSGGEADISSYTNDQLKVLGIIATITITNGKVTSAVIHQESLPLNSISYKGSLSIKDKIESGDIDTNAIGDISLFTQDLRPPRVVNGKPDPGDSGFDFYEGNQVFDTADGKLYTLKSNSSGLYWSTIYDGDDTFDTSITSVAQFASSIQPVQLISSHPVGSGFSFGVDSFYKLLTQDDSPYAAGTLFRWDTGLVEWVDLIDNKLTVNKLTAGQIEAGAIGVEQLSADAIAVGARRSTINSDPDFEGSVIGPDYPWQVAGINVNSNSENYSTIEYPSEPVAVVESDSSVEAYKGSKYLKCEGSLSTATTSSTVYSKLFPVDSNTNYTVRFARKIWDDGGDRSFYVGLQFFDGQGNIISPNTSGENPGGSWKSGASWWITNNVPSTFDWEYTSIIIGPNSDYEFPLSTEVKQARFNILFNYQSGGTTDGDQAIDAVSIQEAASAVTIADGAITADKMTANSVGAGVVQAGVVGTRELKAETILTSRIGVTNIGDSLNADDTFSIESLGTINANYNTIGGIYNSGLELEQATPWATYNSIQNASIEEISDESGNILTSTDLDALVVSNTIIPIKTNSNYTIKIRYRDLTQSGSNTSLVQPVVIFYTYDSSGLNDYTSTLPSGWYGSVTGRAQLKVPELGYVTETSWVTKTINIGPKYNRDFPTTPTHMRLGVILNSGYGASSVGGGEPEVSLLEIKEQLGSTVIEDGAITTNKLNVISPGAGILNPDAGFRDLNSWQFSIDGSNWKSHTDPAIEFDASVAPTPYWVVISGTPGSAALCQNIGSIGNAESPLTFYFRFRDFVDIGRYDSNDINSFNLSFNKYFFNFGGGDSPGVRVYIKLKNTTGINISQDLSANDGIISTEVIGGETYHKILDIAAGNYISGKESYIIAHSSSGIPADIIIPDTAARINVMFNIGTGINGADTVCSAGIASVKLEQRVRGVIIEDGAITANKVAANAITADKLEADLALLSKVRTDEVASDVHRLELENIHSGNDYHVWAGTGNDKTNRDATTFSIDKDGDVYIEGLINAKAFETTIGDDNYQHFVPQGFDSNGDTVYATAGFMPMLSSGVNFQDDSDGPNGFDLGASDRTHILPIIYLAGNSFDNYWVLRTKEEPVLLQCTFSIAINGQDRMRFWFGARNWLGTPTPPNQPVKGGRSENPTLDVHYWLKSSNSDTNQGGVVGSAFGGTNPHVITVTETAVVYLTEDMLYYGSQADFDTRTDPVGFSPYMYFEGINGDPRLLNYSYTVLVSNFGRLGETVVIS